MYNEWRYTLITQINYNKIKQNTKAHTTRTFTKTDIQTRLEGRVYTSVKVIASALKFLFSKLFTETK